MSTAARVSIREFLEFEAPSDGREELIDGEIVLSPDPKPLHSDVQKAIENVLTKAIQTAKASAFLVRSRVNVVLEQDESMPSPDIFVIDRERWNKAKRENTYPAGSPQLAVEVVSPSNSQAHIRRKVELYLKNGSLAVWVVYPKKQKVLLATAEDETEYRIDETIALPSQIAPDGISFAVRDFFEED